MDLDNTLYGTWSNTPDGGYSYTGGVFGGAPPGGTYVPATANPDGSINEGKEVYPATCQTCQAQKKAQDGRRSSRGWYLQAQGSAGVGTSSVSVPLTGPNAGTVVPAAGLTTPSLGGSAMICYGDPSGSSVSLSGGAGLVGQVGVSPDGSVVPCIGIGSPGVSLSGTSSTPFTDPTVSGMTAQAINTLP